ncbi:MAG: hypothetical protein JSU72_13670, partial [Deltaproteobacteria bacterium]
MKRIFRYSLLFLVTLALVALGWATTAAAQGPVMAPAAAAAGDLDPDFGVGGKVTTDFTGPDGEDEATDVVEVDDDKVVVVGWVFNRENETVDFALARYDEDGTLDTSFGTEGKVITDFGGTNDEAHAAVVDDEDRIIVV